MLNEYPLLDLISHTRKLSSRSTSVIFRPFELEHFCLLMSKNDDSWEFGRKISIIWFSSNSLAWNSIAVSLCPHVAIWFFQPPPARPTIYMYVVSDVPLFPTRAYILSDLKKIRYLSCILYFLRQNYYCFKLDMVFFKLASVFQPWKWAVW